MFTNIKAVRVLEVIMQSVDQAQSGSANVIGNIRYNDLNAPKPRSTKQLPFARPLFNNISQYPVVNEIVYLVKGPSSTYYDNNEIISYYLPAIKVQNHPLHNAFPNLIDSSKINLSNEDVEGGASNPNNEELSINLGEYFTEIEKIRPLRPY